MIVNGAYRKNDIINAHIYNEIAVSVTSVRNFILLSNLIYQQEYSLFHRHRKKQKKSPVKTGPAN